MGDIMPISLLEKLISILIAQIQLNIFIFSFHLALTEIEHGVGHFANGGGGSERLYALFVVERGE
jgi:hypothetical protein